MKMRLLAALLLPCAIAPCHAIPTSWSTPIVPFQISGNLYYVGSRDLASYLVVTPKGNILINENVQSSPALIRRSVEQLGFQWSATKILLNSQAHYDHVGGAAKIIRETHAQNMAMEGDAQVIQTGGAADFDPTLPHFPAAPVDRVLHDGDTVSLGGTTLTAHKTAGHTRGCTTWTLQTHPGGRTLNVVIIGGWAPNPGVRLVATKKSRPSYPNIAADYDHTFATLTALPCDIFLGAHGAYFNMLEKLARVPKEGKAVWIDPEGYRKAVTEHAAAYRKTFAQQQAGK